MNPNNLLYEKKTLIMGILNCNTDSFVPQSRYDTLQGAITKAEQMIKEGADIIDIGAESTRPGAKPLSEKEELQRLIPVVRELSKRGMFCSIDTYKSRVAQETLEEGARMINDVSGGKYDPEMFPIAAKYQVPLIIMQNPLRPREFPHVQGNHPYKDVVSEVREDLKCLANTALEHGITHNNIILDPGIGFRKSLENNLLLIKEISKIKDLGYRVLLGVSNKHFIGKILEKEEPHDRIYGTLAITALAAQQRIDIVRVHDIAQNAQVAKMVDALYRKKIKRKK